MPLDAREALVAGASREDHVGALGEGEEVAEAGSRSRVKRRRAEQAEALDLGCLYEVELRPKALGERAREARMLSFLDMKEGSSRFAAGGGPSERLGGGRLH